MKKISKRLLLSKIATCVAIMSNVLNISATNAHKNKLEKIYLLNVVLYMPEQDLTKLTIVNKKSQETLFMMHRATIDARDIDMRQSVEERTELCQRQALNFKELGRTKIQTLDFRGGLSYCLNIVKQAKHINKGGISTLALYGRTCEIPDDCDFQQLLKDCGLINVNKIEMHNVSGPDLYSMLYDSHTFNEKPIIQCDHIDVNTLKRLSQDDDRSFAYIGNSNTQVIIKSVNLNDFTEEEETEEQILKEIFKDAIFYTDTIEYDDDLNDAEVDSARNYIFVKKKCLIDDFGYTETICWNWDNILRLTATQYKKRLRQAVHIEPQLYFNNMPFENLKNLGLIEQDANGTITLIKWIGSLYPISEYPISWKALIGGSDGCEYDGNMYAVDITGFQPSVPNALIEASNADSLIIRDNGKCYAIYGSYIPKFATPHQSFWDQFFDYSKSEITISNDVGLNDLISIPLSINGRIIFHGNRNNEYQRKISDDFYKARRYWDRNVVGEQEINALDKIKEDDLHYSRVDFCFSDPAEDEDKTRTKIHEYALFKNKEITLDKREETVLLHYETESKPTFRYLLKRYKTTFFTNDQNIHKRTDKTTEAQRELCISLPIFQVTGVFDEVYKAPNKRLVIHPEVRQINFQPRAEGKLTFVLGPNISYINKEFWQPGNSYLLSAWKEGITLDYLKRVQDQHEIDISDHPDGFCFWNITKKKSFEAPTNEESFKINKIHVFQMN